MNIYCVYWAVSGADCEKNYDYVFAKTKRDAMNHKFFNRVLVLEVRDVYGKEKEDAVENHWCINHREYESKTL